MLLSIFLIDGCLSGLALGGTTTKRPFIRLSCVGHRPDGFFVDANNDSVFHQCSHGVHIATFTCINGTVFNETEQVCVVRNSNSSLKCPKPDGLFTYPGNVHK